MWVLPVGLFDELDSVVHRRRRSDIRHVTGYSNLHVITLLTQMGVLSVHGSEVCNPRFNLFIWEFSQGRLALRKLA